MTMQNIELISVIIPVYNAEKYIVECVESILHQTYSNWELILVDDGSTDCSAQVCDDYAKNNENVYVLHQQNGGQTAARKAGVSIARGEYIAFVDSDDWVELDFLEELANSIRTTDGRYTLVSSDLIYNKRNGVISPDGGMAAGIYDRTKIEQQILPDFIYDLQKDAIVMRHTMPGMLFDARIMKEKIGLIDEKIRFDEDGILVCNILLAADKIKVIRYKGYHYRENEKSVSWSSDLSMIESLKLLKCAYYKLLSEYVEKEKIDEELARFIQLFAIRCTAHELGCHYVQRFVVPYEILTNDLQTIVYGAGLRGREFVGRIKKNNVFLIKHWVDKGYARFDESLNVESPEIIDKAQYDMILIAIEDRGVQRQVEKYLLGRGVPYDKIWPLESKYYFEHA